MVRARKLLLIFGGVAGDDALLAGLEPHGYDLVRAGSVEAAEAALRGQPVSLAIACPAAPHAAVEGLVSAVERTRRGVPVLAIRDRAAGEPESWGRLGIGVLRRPLLPDALVRSVEVVLGLKKK